MAVRLFVEIKEGYFSVLATVTVLQRSESEVMTDGDSSSVAPRRILRQDLFLF